MDKEARKKIEIYLLSIGIAPTRTGSGLSYYGKTDIPRLKGMMLNMALIGDAILLSVTAKYRFHKPIATLVKKQELTYKSFRFTFEKFVENIPVNQT